MNTTVPDRPLRSEAHVQLRSSTQSLENLLWWFPSLVPLFTILLSFYLLEWYWGLMDDVQLLQSGTNISERFVNYLATLVAFGHFNPTSALRSAVIYTWFEYVPVLAHVAKWVEACLMLLAWGVAAKRVSGKDSALPIFMAVALSFHYLYDTFFFLSTHEVIGLLFLGISINGFLTTITTMHRTTFYASLVASLVCLMVGMGAKEPMVSSGVAFGISFVVLGLMDKSTRSRPLLSGVIILVISFAYAVSLKLWVQSSYTASYSFFNFPRMLDSFSNWVRKDFFNHSPWILLVVVLVFWLFSSRPKSQSLSLFTQKQQWGMLTGALLYVGYLLILLPWNTISYYAGPLGVYFAFPVSIFLAQILPTTKPLLQVLVPVAALIFNMFVSQWALTRESLYHYDTQNLMAWIQGNPEFQTAALSKLVESNALEAGGAIPQHLARDFALALPGFAHRGANPDGYQPGRMLVYTPRFGSPADVFPTDEWITMFYSKYWQVYLKR